MRDTAYPMANTTYTSTTLMQKERIVYAGRLHGFCYVVPIVLIVIGALLTFTPSIPALPTDDPDAEQKASIVDTIKYKLGITKMIKALYEAMPKEMHGALDSVATIRQVYIGLFCLVFGFTKLMTAYIRKISVEHCVTTRKVIEKRGWIAVDSTEISLDNIEGVKVHQTMMDRMLGKGEVLITGIGMEQIMMKGVAEPHEFRKQVLGAVEKFTSKGRSRG